MANANVPRDLVAMTVFNHVRQNQPYTRQLRTRTNLSAVCGSLARGKDRQMRSGNSCTCDEGWTGINCNVCTENKACNALMETGEGGVCYQNGEVVNHNYQMCDVTNEKITTLLGKQRPEVTFTCTAEKGVCDFQCQCLQS